jgi:hypothetical protein
MFSLTKQSQICSLSQLFLNFYPITRGAETQHFDARFSSNKVTIKAYD